VTTESAITLMAAGLAFLASVIAAAVAGFTARFQRFAKERWWDRKAEAYSRIIDALSGVVYSHEEWYDAELEHRGIPDEQRNEIDEHWRKGYAELKRATAIGSFLISAQAEAALAQMWHDTGKGVHPADWFGQLESNYTTASDCLKKLVGAAKKDLGVT